MIELLVVLVLAGLAMAVAVPCLAEMRSAGRVAAGARELALLLQAMRWRAVAEHRNVGLFFQREASGWTFREVEDGNGNGLRTTEVRSGVDPTRSGPRRLEWHVEHVRLGFPDLARIPQIPPQRGAIANLSDPVQFGRSDLVSFSEVGAASSGTLYVTDGRGLCAIVLFGPTSRVRVWRFDPWSRQWKL